MRGYGAAGVVPRAPNPVARVALRAREACFPIAEGRKRGVRWNASRAVVFAFPGSSSWAAGRHARVICLAHCSHGRAIFVLASYRVYGGHPWRTFISGPPRGGVVGRASGALPEGRGSRVLRRERARGWRNPRYTAQSVGGGRRPPACARHEPSGYGCCCRSRRCPGHLGFYSVG